MHCYRGLGYSYLLWRWCHGVRKAPCDASHCPFTHDCPIGWNNHVCQIFVIYWWWRVRLGYKCRLYLQEGHAAPDHAHLMCRYQFMVVIYSMTSRWIQMRSMGTVRATFFFFFFNRYEALQHRHSPLVSTPTVVQLLPPFGSRLAPSWLTGFEKRRYVWSVLCSLIKPLRCAHGCTLSCANGPSKNPQTGAIRCRFLCHTSKLEPFIPADPTVESALPLIKPKTSSILTEKGEILTTERRRSRVDWRKRREGWYCREIRWRFRKKK